MSGAGKDKQYEKNRVFFRADAAGAVSRGAGRSSGARDNPNTGDVPMSRGLYLAKLAYGYLDAGQIMWGFAKYYLCAGLCSRDLCRDVCLEISAAAAQRAGEKLMETFRLIAQGGEKDED